MPKRIFIVDDSEMVRKLVRSHLEARLEHIVCAEASDGLNAIRRAREVRPDLIILDLSMPEMNGLEAAAVLHKLLPNVPMILFTLHEGIVPVKQAQAAGIRAVVSKTDPIGTLLQEVSSLVGVAKSATA